MASQHPSEPELLGPLREGEFRRISGIKEKVEQRLHLAGVETFEQLAALTPEAIYAHLKSQGLSMITAQSIREKDWSGQARILARKLANHHRKPAAKNLGERQHYNSFKIALLQNEDLTVRGTRVEHVQSGEKDEWAGWDLGKLQQWLARKAGLPAIEAPPVPETAADSQPIVEEQPGEAAPPVKDEQRLHQKQAFFKGTSIQLEPGEVFDPQQQRAERFLSAGQPFELRLALSVQQKNIPFLPLMYRAITSLRPLTSREPVTRVEITGPCQAQAPTPLIVPMEGLAAGTYRMETVVRVYPQEAQSPEAEGLTAFAEGLVVHVFTQETIPA